MIEGARWRKWAFFYVPMAYFTDRFFYNRQLAKAERDRQAKAQGGE